MYKMYRTHESLGTVRVSTAYQFFSAVKTHLHLKSSTYEYRQKPIFEATKYDIYYVAADDCDAAGRDDVAFVVDRTYEEFRPRLLRAITTPS